MSDLLALLDSDPASDDERAQRRVRLRDALAHQRPAWCAAVDQADGLSRDQAWRLLAWVRSSAPDVRRDDASLVADAAFAICLLESSPLDRRDVMVVASMLRGAARTAGVDFVERVRSGCADAGELGRATLPWLERIPAEPAVSFDEPDPEPARPEKSRGTARAPRSETSHRVAPRWIRYPVLGLLFLLGAGGLLALVIDPDGQLITGRAVAPAVSGVVLLLVVLAAVALAARARTRLVRRLETLGTAAASASRSRHDEPAAIAGLAARTSRLLIAQRHLEAAVALGELRGMRDSLRTPELARELDRTLAAAKVLGGRQRLLSRRSDGADGARAGSAPPSIDVLDQAQQLRALLQAGGHDAYARALQDAIDSGSTATEIVMRLRWEADRLLHLGEALDEPVLDAARGLRDDLDRLLGRA